jgi:hypothetical protein
MPLIYDGGVESGLDVLRAMRFGGGFLHAGARLALCAWRAGRPGRGASGQILRDDLVANMMQMGIDHAPGGGQPDMDTPMPGIVTNLARALLPSRNPP